MGCRTNARLAQSQPPSGKGFRGVDCERQSLGLHRLCAVAHQKISLTITRSQVSYTTLTIKIRTLRFTVYSANQMASCKSPSALRALARPCAAWSNRAESHPGLMSLPIWKISQSDVRNWHISAVRFNSKLFSY